LILTRRKQNRKLLLVAYSLRPPPRLLLLLLSRNLVPARSLTVSTPRGPVFSLDSVNPRSHNNRVVCFQRWEHRRKRQRLGISGLPLSLSNLVGFSPVWVRRNRNNLVDFSLA
jgi:hypothetical protein